MKLRDLLSEGNLRMLLEEMVEPESTHAPQEKGVNPIKVQGYFVKGHWRKRVRQARAVTVRREKRLRLVRL